MKLQINIQPQFRKVEEAVFNSLSNINIVMDKDELELLLLQESGSISEIEGNAEV